LREDKVEHSEVASEALLRWYDTNAREMPWRVSPANRQTGQRPDPYAVWLSEVMLQQTTVAAVTQYFQRFTARWPDVRALAGAADGDVMGEWAGLGYYARARNLLKCARVVCDDHGGVFPNTYAGLISLPGIGPERAAKLLEAFGSVEAVLSADADSLVEVPGLGKKTADAIRWSVSESAAVYGLEIQEGFFSERVGDTPSRLAFASS